MDYLHLLEQTALLDGRRTGAAIFALEHVKTGRRLIVGAKNLTKRLYDQYRYLYLLGSHHNQKVEADLKRDGPEAFRLILLDVCRSPDQLRYLRLWHIVESMKQGIPLYSEIKPMNLTVPPDVTERFAHGGKVPTNATPELMEASRRLRHTRLPNI